MEVNTPSNLLADLTAPIIATIAVAFGLGVIAPNASFAQDSKEKARQNNKNLMRNLTIGLGAAAVYEGLRGKTTNAAILGAGAALSGKKYEDARKAQSKENNDYRYGYGNPGYNPGYNDNDRYRDDDRFDRNDRYDNDGRFGNDGRYDRNDRPGSYRYNDNGRFGNDRFENNRYDYRRDPRGVSYKTPQPRKDNGKHNGWYKKQSKGDCD